jgi:hypothetical protein
MVWYFGTGATFGLKISDKFHMHENMLVITKGTVAAKLRAAEIAGHVILTSVLH